MSFKCNYNRPKGNESAHQSSDNKDNNNTSAGICMTQQELKKNNETIKNPNPNNNNTNTVNTTEPEVISEDVIDLDDND